MTTKRFATLALSGLLACGLAAAGCSHADDSSSSTDDSEPADSRGVAKAGGPTNGKADASVEAVFLDFAFEGEFLTNSSYRKENQIEDQLLYTVGQLNGDNSVSRIDKLDLTNVEVSETESDKKKISYDVEMLVAWGEKDDVPETYTLKLPRDMTREGKQVFVEDYGEDCIKFTSSDVDANSMWYYYRPESYGCELAGEDLVTPEASVSVSEVNTTGRHPEYHKVWEDDILKVAAVFGKAEEGVTDPSDAGIEAYNEFVGEVRNQLEGNDLTTSPQDAPTEPGIEVPNITFEATLDETHRVEVHAILVDNVRTAGPDFDETYEKLSRDADLITYNGHSGLGSNIRALARKGDWQENQYNIVFMNGCDTYAYVDDSLAEANAAVNPDDDTGTKYLDLVMNAMPSYFKNNAESTMALMKGLMNYEEPQTYERMLENISPSQVVLVSGEQDNEFVPGMMEDGNGDGDGENDGGDIVEQWEGFTESGTVTRDEQTRYETPTLAAGTYRLELSGTGDADLYVRIGDQPTTDTYDCRPYRAGSKEICEVELSSPAPLHAMVRGWDDSSEFELEAARK